MPKQVTTPDPKTRAALEPTVGEVERRLYAGKVELKRDAAVDGLPKLTGYAAVFDSETMIGSPTWGFREQIAKGAFIKAIKQDDVRGLFNHDENQLLGRTKSNTLRLVEDDTGLRYEIDTPDTQLGRDVANLVSRGDLDGSSFAFVVTKDSWEYPSKDSTDRPLRTVQEVELFDVSPVTYPAYPTTSVTVSARAKQMATSVVAATIPARTATPTSGKTKTRDDGSPGGGAATDVGGDGSGDAGATTSAAIQKTIRAAKNLQKCSRAMVKALDISHGFNPSDGDLTAPGGSSLDTGRSKKQLKRDRHRNLKKGMKVVRDSGDAAPGAQQASATMYYSGRSVRRLANAANHSMNALRTMCRYAGINLTRDDGGDGSAMGSDAGASGANAKKAAIDLAHRAHQLELERLR